MRKHKITGLKKYADLHEEKQVTGDDGTVVTIRTHIPYADKIEFAREWVENTIITHDDSCWYTGYEQRLYEIYLVAKYYTDIQTAGAEPQEIADFMLNNGLFGKIDDALYDDLYEVRNLHYLIQESFGIAYDDDRSLTKAVRTSFGFLFNGEDITESLAKAEAMKDVVYNAINALYEKEEDEAKKLIGGKVKMSGNVIDFAKKQI